MLVTTNFGIWKSIHKRTFFHDVKDKNTRSSDRLRPFRLGVVFTKISMGPDYRCFAYTKEGRLALTVNQIPDAMPQAYAPVLKLGNGPVGGAFGISRVFRL